MENPKLDTTPPVIGKRINNRFPVLNCRVQLKAKKIMGLFGKKFYHLSLIDLSTTGIQVISSQKLNHRRKYDILIQTPAFRRPISTKGSIVWNQPFIGRDNTQYYRVGIEFTYFKEMSIKRLQALEMSPELRKVA